mmetsp:Transcript_4248/g.5964  ORF Transcript_4248/g.5964 Transcript_4248/m.5964 type:complete len:160 (-) Transcript_4248:798-1277(-)
MRRHFSGQVIQAFNEQLPVLAREIYQQTEALPQTETENRLKIEGYLLNGPLHAGNDAIVICYKGLKVYLLKALTNKEYSQAAALQDQLQGETNRYLTSFEIHSHASKNFIIMPYYISTLEPIPTLSVDDGQQVVQQVSEAIMFLKMALSTWTSNRPTCA